MKPVEVRVRNISGQVSGAGASVWRLVRCKTHEQRTWRIGRLVPAAIAALSLVACEAPPPPSYSFQPPPYQYYGQGRASPGYGLSSGYTPAMTVSPPLPPQSYVPEPPAPKQPECNNWFFTCAGAEPSHPAPSPPPVEPVETDDCHGWWRVCHAWQ